MPKCSICNTELVQHCRHGQCASCTSGYRCTRHGKDSGQEDRRRGLMPAGQDRATSAANATARRSTVHNAKASRGGGNAINVAAPDRPVQLTDATGNRTRQGLVRRGQIDATFWIEEQ